LHYEGQRRDYPFMEVNCAAITDTLFESELFGHEKGSFTDAKATKKGLMELADHGTLFLDEVSEMSLGSQAKLLRSLQERVVRRVGGTRDIKVDVRIIAATNRALETQVKEGRFREDLYYRLNVIPVTIPPVRSRRDDILPLARHFLLELNSTFHKTIRGFAPETEKLLQTHHWPGNVRELKNLVQRVLIIGGSEEISLDEVEQHLVAQQAPDEPLVKQDLLALPLREAREQFERAYLLQQLMLCNGKVGLLAKRVGMERTHLYRKLRSLGVDFRQITED
jgi:DNA-binding NtrC family response regulator